MDILGRRAFLGGCVAAMAMPVAAWALTAGQSRSVIEGLVNDINRVIDSGKSEGAMYRDFERLFGKYADTAYIAAYALGADGRQASTAQKRAFSDAFIGYIARKYGSRFREFIGGRLEVNDARAVKNYFEVRTTAHLRGESPFSVTFHISDRTGKPLMFNLYIEGVNMLLTERSEVGAMLDRRGGNIDAMTADLKKAG